MCRFQLFAIGHLQCFERHQELILAELGVTLRDLDRAVPHPLLHDVQVDAPLHEARRTRVTQAVDGEPLVALRLRRVRANLQHAAREAVIAPIPRRFVSLADAVERQLLV